MNGFATLLLCTPDCSSPFASYKSLKLVPGAASHFVNFRRLCPFGVDVRGCLVDFHLGGWKPLRLEIQFSLKCSLGKLLVPWSFILSRYRCKDSSSSLFCEREEQMVGIGYVPAVMYHHFFSLVSWGPFACVDDQPHWNPIVLESYSACTGIL